MIRNKDNRRDNNNSNNIEYLTRDFVLVDGGHGVDEDTQGSPQISQ